MTRSIATRQSLGAGILALPIGLALLVPGTTHAQTVQGTFERALTVTGQADLDVTTGSGDVVVRTGPAGAVRIVGRIHAADSWFGTGRAAADKVKAIEAKPPVEQTGNAIRIGRIDDQALQRNVSIDYDITVPAQCKIRSHTGSGDQNIGDISGPVEIGSGSGDLVLGAIGGRVDATTGSGDITAGAAREGFGAKTGSGDVHAKGVGGEIAVSTGSGDVEIDQSAPGNVRVSAASGDVTLRGVQGALRVDTASGSISVQGTPTGEWQLSSASGEITLELPQTVGFDVDARSNSGTIESKHAVTMTGTIDRYALAGKVRGGGPLIKLHSSSGNIRIQ
jgi:DUF4097 and DUF4098 domain-containing protein YvlB